jgi:hypothetical protein
MNTRSTGLGMITDWEGTINSIISLQTKDLVKESMMQKDLS